MGALFGLALVFAFFILVILPLMRRQENSNHH